MSILALVVFPELASAQRNVFLMASGAIFGVYLAIVAVCWLWVYAHNNAASVIWNVMASALTGAIIIWFMVGMDTPRVICVLIALLAVSAHLLTKRMSLLSGSPLDQSSLPVERHTPAFIIVATFLFSYAFMVSLSFAGLEYMSSAFSMIAILIPFLLVTLFMLSFKRLTSMSLLNVAVPIVVTAALSASFLNLDPIVTLDLALVGILLLLVYVVVILCAITEKTDSHAYRAFSLFMLAYFGGCIIGRGVSALSLFGSPESKAISHDIVVFSSVLAILIAMLFCIRNGFTPKQLIDLYDPSRANNEEHLTESQAAQVAQIAARYNLGNREQEVLELLLQQRTANEIATEMVIASGTAKSHIRHIYKKLSMHSREELFEMFDLNRQRESL